MTRTKTAASAVDSHLVAALKDNEIKANRMCCIVLVFMMIMSAASMILTLMGVFKVNHISMLICTMTIVFQIIPVICNRSGRFSSGTIKVLVLVCVTLTVLVFDVLESYNIIIAIIVPVLFSVLYFDRRLVTVTALVSALLFGLEMYISSFFSIHIDANHVALPEGTVLVIEGGLKETLIESGYSLKEYAVNTLLNAYLPRLISLAVVVVIAYLIVKFGQEMLLKRIEIASRQAQLSTELELAHHLQEKSLPDSARLNGRYDFEVAAYMHAARETGGDFYDFAMLDENHLALCIADVSGKGVPAAMYMMSAKAKLGSAMNRSRTPSEVLKEVNMSLCEEYDGEMFVSLWLGILDVETGVLTSVNAGHQNVMVRYPKGEYFEISRPHDMIMGMLEEAEYSDIVDNLWTNNVLFLFTDGVTEACNAEGEMFGSQRLLEALNRRCSAEGMTAEEILEEMKEELSGFAGDTEQFDDITMLVFRYL